MAEHRTVKVGDTVKLTRKASRNHRCSIDREPNRTAVVQARDDQSREGAWRKEGIEGGLFMNRDLKGCRWWNEADVEIVKKGDGRA